MVGRPHRSYTESMVSDFLAHHASLTYELAGVFAVLGGFVVVAGVLISRLEHTSLEEGVYFAVMTAFTVGFGDITPRTRGGRIVAMLLSFLGVVLIGIFVAIAAAALDRVLPSP